MAQGRWAPNRVKSDFIRNEIRKCSHSNYEDRVYVDDLLNLEHWILHGESNRDYRGLWIPYFCEDHPTQVITRRKREYRKIFMELKGKEEYDNWYRQFHNEKWYSQRRYLSDNAELLRRVNISRIESRSLLIYKCNKCGRTWQFRALPMNGEYARRSQPNSWWKCPNGCNQDILLKRKSRKETRRGIEQK